MEFRVLGPLEVRDGERTLPLAGAKQRALLALMLLHANHVLSRDRLIDELWGEQPPETAVTSLQVYVSRLRKLLPPGTLLTRPPGYLLEVDTDELDLQRFERLFAEGHQALTDGDAERAAIVLNQALAFWRGPALAEFAFEPFAQAEIARLEDLRLAAIEERIEAELAVGRHADLIGELESLIADNPHRERLRGQLMLALYRSGRQAEALEGYRQTRRTLDELGIEPSENLRQLEKAVLTHDPALQAAPVESPRTPTNLPVQASPLVGRKRELAELLELLETNRLVALTGAGGSGKTRLALQAAAELLEDFADGVWFVSFAAVTDPELVDPTIAQVLGAPGALDEFLNGKQILLVLDNLEQLLPGVAQTVARLDAKVLATSRERLNITAEQEYPVPPLPLDDAVALFTQRARKLKPAFEADEDAAKIAGRLDGLPLAIELAAARVNVLSTAAILERLDKRLSLLTGGARDVPERQRTLRATIDWSYELLTTEEKGLFARLAVFASGCTLDGAEQVCAAELDTLASLVDKSLILLRGDRYLMLETIREYALERLEERGERDRISRALAEYLVTLVEESPGVPQRFKPLSAGSIGDELDNMRTALAWALAAPDPELALRLASEAMWFSRGMNTVPEQSRWLDEALRTAGSVSPHARARALQQAASCACVLGDFERSRALGEQALRLYQELRDEPSCISVLRRLGDAATGTGDYVRARALYEESHELAERLSDARVYYAIQALGEFELAAGGDLHRAAELLERSETLARSAGDDWFLTNVLRVSGDVALAQRDHPRALVFYREALRLSHQLNNWRQAVYCVAAVAAVAALDGDTSRAGRLSGAREPLELELGWRVLGDAGKTYDAALAVCSKADPIVFATAAERGRRMSIEEIVDYALCDGD